MARIVLASSMLASLREAVGAENDTHVTDTELYKVLTRAVSDTWDTILMYGIGTEAVTSVSFNAVAGQLTYPITAMAADFYQLSRLYVVDNQARMRPVSRVNPSEQYTMKAPTQGASMKLYYFPCAPIFTTGAESFDGINGWEEHVIMNGCIYVKSKKEDDTGQFRARKREIEARMAVMANRLRDEPPRVVRRAAPYIRNYFSPVNYHGRGYAVPYDAGVRGYDLRGANLELLA